MITNIEIEAFSALKSACRRTLRKKRLKSFKDISELEKFAENVDVDNVVCMHRTIILTYYEI